MSKDAEGHYKVGMPESNWKCGLRPLKHRGLSPRPRLRRPLEEEAEDYAMTFEELTAQAYSEELDKARALLPPDKQGSVPPIPPDFLKSFSRS